MKKSQLIMIWFLPLIVIGGLFYPWLGYFVVAMMAFFLILAFFAGRYWCWNLCPRGSFLDIVLSKFSLNKPIPRVLVRPRVRLFIFIAFLCFVAYRIIRTGGDLLMIGAVFVSMCLITTVISLFLGVTTKARGWCAVCPMGFFQEKIHKLNRQKGKNKDGGVK